MKRFSEEDVFDFIRAVQKTDKYDDYLQVMKEFKSLPYSFAALNFVATKIKRVFNGHSNLILGFNRLFLPENFAIEEDDDGANQIRVFNLKSRQRVQAESSNKALLDEFDYHEDYKFFENVRKEKFRNPDDYRKFLKCLHLYSKQKISRDELMEIVGELLQYGTKVRRTANMDQVNENCRKHERESSLEASESKRRRIVEPVMDNSRRFDCEIENPSYQPATEIASASRRTELGAALLNDYWVSNETPATGDTYNFKRNAYEENLFKFEDDRCERDRQLELVKGTIERLEELLQRIEYNTVNPDSIRLEDHFKVLYLGCIRSLYGESWQDVLDALPNNAVPVLQGMLTRLRKKLREVNSRLSAKYKKKMAKVYARNFKKSLDHGNSSCEQQNTSSSSDKDSCPDLLAEATE